MSAFTVTVYTHGAALRYPAIGASSCEVLVAAIELFGPCAITVLPLARGGLK
jgi:hypothetical protein